MNSITHSAESQSQILLNDQKYVWHPYSSLSNPIPAYEVVSAEGVKLRLADGTELIDGMSSWWCTIHGYNHPVLNDAAVQQIGKVSHVMFGGITHAPAVNLCEKLVAITPAGLDKVFLADSGSVAVEVAIKMVFQYWISKGQPEKNKLLSLRNGYHGDTFAAMSVCDPVTGMHHLFEQVVEKHYFAPAPQTGFDQPWDEQDIAEFSQKISDHSHRLAAVILEPVVQGAGGMRFYSPYYLKRVRELCDKHNVLLIADEIATGFGRTGKLFACEWADISPDVLCLGKAITGGYMTLAATLCTDKVSRGICEGEAGCFMHGPTFMGNPLACSVANASIDLLLSADWQSNIQRIESTLKQQLVQFSQLKSVASTRALGAIGVIEMHEPVSMAEIQKQFVEAGVWVRPFGKLVYVMPPFISSDENLIQLMAAIFSVLEP
ncbi:adenosylmethionine--8-amino-7-oxononanoate transaminase [Porticoccaceae bacterium]|nr:adenosylmethionine--8-amino-7-oxononanoate transaminase [Porticoccaceae bacterium]MDA8903572.1 adenosylmethionine--8-amino-7-oxononanoate transaminase [Porticoccaceae bacterium]MDA8920063.1 adenosylmethionine--8-amino-7-oxononanoate transaminase [Porticoccaceae bacterium]